jgi:hypothetical protein
LQKEREKKNRKAISERKLQMRKEKEKRNQWHTSRRGLIPCKE